jgi:hypothetical protein
MIMAEEAIRQITEVLYKDWELVDASELKSRRRATDSIKASASLRSAVTEAKDAVNQIKIALQERQSSD